LAVAAGLAVACFAVAGFAVAGFAVAGFAVAGLTSTGGFVPGGRAGTVGTIAVAAADCRVAPLPGRRASPAGMTSPGCAVTSGGPSCGARPDGATRGGAAERPVAPDPPDRVDAVPLFFLACDIVHLPQAARGFIVAAVIDWRLDR